MIQEGSTLAAGQIPSDSPCGVAVRAQDSPLAVDGGVASSPFDLIQLSTERPDRWVDPGGRTGLAADHPGSTSVPRCRRAGWPMPIPPTSAEDPSEVAVGWSHQALDLDPAGRRRRCSILVTLSLDPIIQIETLSTLARSRLIRGQCCHLGLLTAAGQRRVEGSSLL